MDGKNKEKTKIEELRERIAELQEERKHVILEKGLSAQENNDLRENAQYDFWDRKEHNYNSRIAKLTHDLELLKIRLKPKKSPKRSTKKERIEKIDLKNIPKSKWL
ncbi:hypothetical protein A3K34_01070 [candidate division WWE3 bacterium RIFOXYC1_FULL_40_10]|uniref:Transcription elongation factor GreA/GreB N-terminal domain-containing protein n=1 Tax=candidate division WWE3 bacterium RIFOXYA2_FULL_46_9 TaxID=1802636 RepID=A0A1F4W1V5_UNCKA|nr:MAG: hypothetical protein A3K58_01070 [candidate division WWE3 bacterium RIFOXYB1_FULL_40_22]OGC61460.1 MAG: hypothetical protein A3K37_01070 [candidate division WWE3 bacterium RIFOXYA1_FULL_40_11]OGC63394.1 MAG: hypothetical protein A2264_01545 [candidate division WWE3 bacterium RIFOXYA2_FULL_46_9]OGC64576.1 MAG: hypothetical protein A2326_03690 [candidate division WWE3 bacterium RIFOXYB2_FULL_41_6]OGC65843.1 MAG: hypothetical protein A3K34_01070 [candidate division WWE3 bacterium RIFOXYC1_